MHRTSLAAIIAAVFLTTATVAAAQGTAGGRAGDPAAAPPATAGGQPGGNAVGTGRTPTGAAVPGTKVDGQQAGAKSQLDRGDRKFLEKAALGGLKEVEFGKVAAGKAQDPAVKVFAERMVKDHGDANKKLTDIAQSKGMAPPAEIKSADRRDLERMEKQPAGKFDAAYMADMVKDHKADVRDFEKAAKGAKDPDVKRFAADTLPTLQQHLRMAEETNAKLKGGAKAGNAKQ